MDILLAPNSMTALREGVDEWGSWNANGRRVYRNSPSGGSGYSNGLASLNAGKEALTRAQLTRLEKIGSGIRWGFAVFATTAKTVEEEYGGRVEENFVFESKVLLPILNYTLTSTISTDMQALKAVFKASNCKGMMPFSDDGRRQSGRDDFETNDALFYWWMFIKYAHKYNGFFTKKGTLHAEIVIWEQTALQELGCKRDPKGNSKYSIKNKKRPSSLRAAPSIHKRALFTSLASPAEQR